MSAAAPSWQTDGVDEPRTNGCSVSPGWPERVDGDWPLIFGLPPERRIDGGVLDLGVQREGHNALRLFPEVGFDLDWAERLSLVPPERGWVIHEVDGVKVVASVGPFWLGDEGDVCAPSGRCASMDDDCRTSGSCQDVARCYPEAASIDWSAGLDEEV